MTQVTFLKQQNDELFKENRHLRDRLVEVEIRLGSKLSEENKECCGKCK